MDAIKVKVKKLHERAKIPVIAKPGDACFDLSLIVDYDPTKEGPEATIAPLECATFRSGLAFEIPEGYAMLIYPRSSTGIKKHLRLCNGTGVIDSGYRGEVVIALHNTSVDDIATVVDGERIAQARIVPVLPTEFEEADDLSESARGAGGIGSTGVL